MNNLEKIQQKIGYQFNNVKLLKQALTHRSAGKNNNERLEFLGDSILNLTIAQLLYHQFPHSNEGELSRMRATLVRESTLAKLARKAELGTYIFLGGGELKSGGSRRESILADCVEAIIGAISLDSNLTTIMGLIQNWYADLLLNIKPGEEQKDPKSRLQELLQAHRMQVPVYSVINVKGADHCQVFTVDCHVACINQSFIGTGQSRRKAEQAAAEIALTAITNKEQKS